MKTLERNAKTFLLALLTLLVMFLALYYPLHLGATRAPGPISGLFSKAESLAQVQS